MSNTYWKPVKGYEGLYEVSNTGLIKSVARYSFVYDSKGRKYKRRVNERILKNVDVQKYKRVSLSKNGITEGALVHIVMMNAFIPNPQNLPCVNHKDENPSNNFIWINDDGTVDTEKSNLEWCTHQYNTNYGTCPNRIGDKNSKKVLQFTIEGQFVKDWKSLAEIERTLGFSGSNISNSIRGKISTKYPYGFLWKYA